MPNWCNTKYAFYGDENQLQDFHTKLSKYISPENKNQIENGFGSNWLGNVVHGFGLDWEKTPCRGALFLQETDIEKDKYFILETDTAWAPMPEMWDEILDKHYRNIEFDFRAVEEGALIFVNTDQNQKYLKGKYYISYYNKEEEAFRSKICSSDTEKDNFIKELPKDTEYQIFEFGEYYY